MSTEVQIYSPLPEVSFEPEDLTLPRWKVDNSGKFVNTVTGEEKEQLTIIILKADRSRFYWPETFSPENLPLCYSVNGVFPEDQSTSFGKEVNGRKVCNGCSMANWSNGSKPKCAISYNYLLMDLETERMAVLNLSRARTATARALNSQFMSRGIKDTILLYTEREKASNGVSFWQVRFQVVETLEPESWQEFAMMMHRSKPLELTGSIEQVKEEVVIEASPAPNIQVNPETGEVTEIPF